MCKLTPGANNKIQILGKKNNSKLISVAMLPTYNNIFKKIFLAIVGECCFNKGMKAVLNPPANNKFVIKSGKLSRRIAISISLKKPNLKDKSHSRTKPEILPKNNAKLRIAEDFIKLFFTCLNNRFYKIFKHCLVFS